MNRWASQISHLTVSATVGTRNQSSEHCLGSCGSGTDEPSGITRSKSISSHVALQLWIVATELLLFPSSSISQWLWHTDDPVPGAYPDSVTSSLLVSNWTVNRTGLSQHHRLDLWSKHKTATELGSPLFSSVLFLVLSLIPSIP